MDFHQQQPKPDVFIDAETFSGGNKFELTFRDLIFRQLNKISINSDCEFRGGYWNESSVNTAAGGMIVRTYIPDSRDKYSNSVMHLYNLILPHIDQELKEKADSILQKIKDVFLKYSSVVEDAAYEVDQSEDRYFSSEGQKVSFRTKKRELLEELFREICCFLKRVDYFDGKTYSDEVN